MHASGVFLRPETGPAGNAAQLAVRHFLLARNPARVDGWARNFRECLPTLGDFRAPQGGPRCMKLEHKADKLWACVGSLEG